MYMNNHMHDCNNKAKVLIQNFDHNNTKCVDFFKNNYMIMITLFKKIINLANNYLINMTTPTFDMSS